MDSQRFAKIAVVLRVLQEITLQQSQYHAPVGLSMNCQLSIRRSFDIRLEQSRERAWRNGGA